MVLESVLVSFFYKWLTSFPSTTLKEIVFSPLCILASFVIDSFTLSGGINSALSVLFHWSICTLPTVFIKLTLKKPIKRVYRFV